MRNANYRAMNRISFQCVDACLVAFRNWTVFLFLALMLCNQGLYGAETDHATASLKEQAQQASDELLENINWDQEATPLVHQDAHEQISVVGAMTQMFLGLIFIVVLMLGAAWAYKRWGQRFVQAQAGQRHMEVLETMNIGVRRSVALVRVADQVLVIGQGEHEMNTLTQMPLASLKPQDQDQELSSESDSEEKPAQAEQEAPLHNFKRKLQSVLQQK